MNAKCLAGSAVLALLVFAPRAFATPSLCDGDPGNLIQNCGFENATAQGQAATDWTLTRSDPGAGDEVDAHPHTGIYSYYFGTGAAINNGYSASLSQAFNSISGENYVVTFYVNPFLWMPGTQTFNVSVENSGNAKLGGWSAPSSISGWNKETFDFIGDGGTDTLLFASTNTNTWDGNAWWIDDIQVDAVPEPASLALLGFGLLAFGGLAMRRRRSRR